MSIDPTQFRQRPVRKRRVTPMCLPSSLVGVTVVSPAYQHLLEESISRFRAATGLDVVVLWTSDETGFGAKLNLDLLLAPRAVVFFDIDLWMLRPFNFSALAAARRFCAVHDPGVWVPNCFPRMDCEREEWHHLDYFNSGLFVCDLGQPEIRNVFADARARLRASTEGGVPPPRDITDQFYLNWAVQRQPGLFQRMPFELNFYKVTVDGGAFPHIPREIIGLHAAGVPVDQKLERLRTEAAVFGAPVRPMTAPAREHFQAVPGSSHPVLRS
jgi:hypothetical protein